MGALFTIEIEPEALDWLEALPARHFLKIDEYVGLLAERAESLGEHEQSLRSLPTQDCSRGEPLDEGHGKDETLPSRPSNPASPEVATAPGIQAA